MDDRAPQRVGLVGSGHRVRTVYVPILDALADRFELAGFTSRSRERRTDVGARTGAPGYESAADLLAAAEPDIVVVAVSGEANEAVTRELLGTGVPLLVETPWAWSTTGARSLLDAVPDDALVAVAEQFPFLPVEQLRRRLIDEGVLGLVHAAHNESAVWDYHGIAQLRRYLGELVEPAEVRATRFSMPLVSPEDPATPRSCDGYVATITHAGGEILSQRFVNFYDPPLRLNRHLTIDGELGSVADDEVRALDRTSGRVEAGTVERVTEPGPDGDRLLRLEVDLGRLGHHVWENPFADHVLSDEQIAVASHLVALGDAARGQGRPLYSPQQALGDVEIMHAIGLSATHGRPVSLPVNVRLEQLRTVSSPTYVRSKLAPALDRLGARVHSTGG